MEYDAANKFLKERINHATTLSSHGIGETMSEDMKIRCFFSARVSEERILEKLRDVSDRYSRGELGLTEARVILKKWLDKNDSNSNSSDNRITNLASTARLNLILSQNQRMAAAVGRYEVSMDEDIKERFPSWRYITGNNPRDTHQYYDGMIFSKDDPIWRRIYPPWEFNCNCDVEDSDEDPQSSKGFAPPKSASGYSFDPQNAFGENDYTSIKNVTKRADIKKQVEEKFKHYQSQKKAVKNEIAFKDMDKLTPNEIKELEEKYGTQIDNNLTQNERDYIQSFTGGSFETYNKYLRDKKALLRDNPYLADITDDIENEIKYIASGLDKCKIDDNLVLYRRVNRYNSMFDDFDNYTSIEDLIESKIANKEVNTLKGFTSTTIHKDEDRTNVFGKYLIQLNVPKGTSGTFVKSISNMDFEDEFLLNKDLKYVITKYEEVELDNSGRTQILYIDIL